MAQKNEIEAVDYTAKGIKSLSFLWCLWDTTSASPDTWPVSEKQGEKERSRQKELERKDYMFEEQEEDWHGWIINLGKNFLRWR